LDFLLPEQLFLPFVLAWIGGFLLLVEAPWYLQLVVAVAAAVVVVVVVAVRAVLAVAAVVTVAGCPLVVFLKHALHQPCWL
jgi:hypothetical protein